MTTVLTSQYTTPNLTIDATNGTAYAYRRYGKAATVPFIFFQHGSDLHRTGPES